MVQSRKRRLTFMEKGDLTVVITILLSIVVLTTFFYYIPINFKSYTEFSEEYKQVALAIAKDSEEGKLAETPGLREKYTIIRKYDEISWEDTYYYSIDNEKKTITVKEYLEVLSYEYSVELGEGILSGYENRRLINAALPAVVFTIIEFLVGALAFGIAALPRCIKRMFRRKKAKPNENKPKT